MNSHRRGRIKPHVVIDRIISSLVQAEELTRTFRGANCRIVMISGIDVYRAGGVFRGTDSGPY
jgi:hypothetical protein